MNTRNANVPASSSENTRSVIHSRKSKSKINEQTGPSMSNRETLHLTTPKSTELKKLEVASLDKRVVDAFESVMKFTDPYIYKHLNVKGACETLSEDLTLVTRADKKLFLTLKSIIKFFKQIAVDDKTHLQKLAELEMALESISSRVLLLTYADNTIVDVIKKVNVSIEQFSRGKIDLISLFVEVQAFYNLIQGVAIKD